MKYPREGTKNARIIANSWKQVRKAQALSLCSYIEYDFQEIYGSEHLVASHEETVDCLFYGPQGSVDKEKYHEADKIIGFPWCLISKDPIINSVFIERRNGRRWIVTGILSIDPIEGFVRCSGTIWHEKRPITKLAYGSISVGIETEAIGCEEEMFWTKQATGSTEQVLTDSYVEVQNSVFGPPQERLELKAGQRVRFAYELSIQTASVGLFGSQVMYKFQKSLQPVGQPAEWIDVLDAVADFSTATENQKSRDTWAHSEEMPDGVPSGMELLYRIVAKRANPDNGAILHYGNINPTVSIDAEFLYKEPEESTAEGSVATPLEISATGEIVDEETSGSSMVSLEVSGTAEKTGESSGIASTGLHVSGTAEEAAETSGQSTVSVRATGTAEAVEDSSGSIAVGLLAVGTAEKVDQEESGDAEAGLTVTGTAEEVEESTGSLSLGVLIEGQAEVAVESEGQVIAGFTATAEGEPIDAEAEGSLSIPLAISGYAEAVEESQSSITTPFFASGTAEEAIETSGQISSGILPAATAETAKDAEGIAQAGLTVAGSADKSEEAAGQIIAPLHVAGTAEIIDEEVSGSIAPGLSLSATGYVVEETIWTAETSDPDAKTLGLTYEAIEGSTVIIPAHESGYPNIRLVYNASMALLAVGDDGGLSTFRLMLKIGDSGTWTEVTGETATAEFEAKDGEDRVNFALTAGFPSGIDPDTAIYLQLEGKTDEEGKEVNVHDSLIDPDNTAPSFYVQGEYFFS